MKNLNQKTPIPANYHILSLIEQMVSSAPKGTDLAMCDLMSALLSGYFVESGGSMIAAVDAFLQQTIKDDDERAARSRRAAKMVRYGQYNLEELITSLHQIMENEGQWQSTRIQGYQIKPVDFTYFRRQSVKKLKSKVYDSTAGKAVPATSFGLIGTTGMVGEQRVARLDAIVMGQTEKNEPSQEMKWLLRQVAKHIEKQDIAVFDAGFGLAQILEVGIENCLIRMPKNCTFGKTPGQIPERQGSRGRTPTQHKAEIVRPLARKHGDNLLPATPADTVYTQEIDGEVVTLSVWQSLYLLERQLKNIEDEAKKKLLRNRPLKVIAVQHPDYDDPILLATTEMALKPDAMYQIYPERWPIEGIPQTAKYLLSGGGGRHFVHHPISMTRLPALTLIFGTLLKYVAATLPPLRTGFWDRSAKPTYGRLMRHLKKVGIRLSSQLFKKESVTDHLPVGYEAIRLSMT